MAKMIPFDTLGIGTAAGIVSCDQCGKRISVRGIRPEILERGEYQVQFFYCIHCGTIYQINTTDEKQRELIQKRAEIARKIWIAYHGKFRAQTSKRYASEENRIAAKIQERAAELRKIGETLLSQKRVTE